MPVSSASRPDDAIVVASENQTHIELDDRTAILALKTGVYYTLNETGSRIWSLIQKPCSIAELRQAMVREYVVNESASERDLFEFLEKMISEDLVELRGAQTT
jgi:coenzyme PQQ synthesis protein D (PqqD)